MNPTENMLTARLTALAHGEVHFAGELATDARTALAGIGLPSPDPRPIVAMTEGASPSGLVPVPWLAYTRLAPNVHEETEALLAHAPEQALAACVESCQPGATSHARFVVLGRDPISECWEDLIAPPTQGGGPCWTMCPGRTILDRTAAIDGDARTQMLLPGAEVHHEGPQHIVRHGARIIRLEGAATGRALKGQDASAQTLEAMTARARLASRGLLVARPGTDVPALERWALAGVSPSLAEHTLRQASLHIVAEGAGCQALAEQVRAIARHYGIAHVQAAGGARTLCLVTDDLASATVEAFARGTHATQRPWMLVLWRTPHLVMMQGGAGARPCLECARRTVLDGAMAIALEKTAANAWREAGDDIAMHIGRRIARVSAGVEPSGTLAATEVGYNAKQRTAHIAPRPDCPVCGVPGLRDAIGDARTLRRTDLLEEAMEDHAQAEIATARLLGRAHKLRGPWTGRWVRHHTRRFAGDRAEQFLHAAHAPAGVLAGSDPAAHPTVPSSGKGRTRRQARAAALGEAVQARAAHYKRGRQHGIEIASAHHLAERGLDLISPEQIGRFSATQHAERACVGLLFRRRAYAPERYTEQERHRERRWMLGRDLETGAHVYVPAESVLRAVPEPSPCMVAGLRAGGAAGPSRLAASIAALHERIERDALSMWWVARRRCPTIDLDAVEDPWVRGAKAAIAAQGRTLAALDITTTPKAPTVLAMSALGTPRSDGSVEPIVRTACAPTRAQALKDAIAENVQGLPEGIEDDAFPGVNPAWEEVRAWRALGGEIEQWLDGTEGEVTVERTGDGEEEADPQARYDAALEAARDAGAERIVGVDLTEPGDPAPSVAVVTPGLRSQLIEKAPGRYDRLHRWSRAGESTRSEAALTPLGMVL